MLNFVKGRAGTGKTTHLHDLFSKLVREGNDKLLFIVPDNATFDTQNMFLNEIGANALSNIKVMGFKSVSSYIFEQTGNLKHSFADDGIKHVIMNMAISECQDELELFKSRVNSKDLCDLMLDTLADFKYRAISVDDLSDVFDKCEDEKLKLKLKETISILKAYDTLLSKSYLDPLDSLTKVTEILQKEKLFEGYTIAVDSHKAFSKQQYGFLRELLIESKDIYFSILTDESNDTDSDLFLTNNKMYQNIKRMADEEHIKTAEPIVLHENYRAESSKEFSAIESYLYRHDKGTYTDEIKNLKVYSAQSIYDESDYVSRTIRKLVKEDGYRYKDIAIVSRNVDKYLKILDLSLEKYGISYFMSKKQDIDSKPLVKMVMSIFNIARNHFDKDDILSLLKTGLTSYSHDEITMFENYVFLWDINRYDFLREFKNNPTGFKDEDKITDSEREELRKIEDMRKSLISKLELFVNSTKEATGREISVSLMNLLYSLEVEENIEKLANIYEKQNIFDSEELYRMWNILCEVLEKMVYVLGDYKVPVKRFSELLATHFSNTEIGFIPSGLDQVTIYDATTLSINDKKIVFVIGCNDTEFPNTVLSKSLFSKDECSKLKDLSLDVEDSLEEFSSEEKMYVYVALTRATEKLFVSFYNNEISGDIVESSNIISEFSLIFPELTIDSFDNMKVEDHLWGEKSAFEYVTDNYEEDNKEVNSIKEYFSNLEKYDGIFDAIDNEINREDRNIKDPNMAKAIFKPNMNLSASKVNDFYLCKFKYFINYGLHVQERRQAKIDHLEYGTLMHYVLESFLRNHKEKNNDFSKIDKKAVEIEVSDILDSYARNHLGGLEEKDSRFLYLFSRMKKTAIEIVNHIVEELAQSEFVPSDFELSIGDKETDDVPAYHLKVTDDINISVVGKVDRVDIYEHEGKKYLRIIDYKTGNKEYDLSDILYGINLQMLMYLSILNVNGKDKYGNEITPAGMLYVPAKTPNVKINKVKDIAKKDSEINKELKMHGLVLDDPDVIKAMEKNTEGIYIPVEYTNKGEIYARCAKNVANLSEIGLLFKKVDCLLREMALSLTEGKVNDVPTKGNQDACRFCKYQAICNHKDTDEYLFMETKSKEDIYKSLVDEEEQDNE